MCVCVVIIMKSSFQSVSNPCLIILDYVLSFTISMDILMIDVYEHFNWICYGDKH